MSIKGTVLKSTGSRYQILLENNEVVDAVMRGKFRLSGIKSTNPIAVGDRVAVESVEETWVVSELLPRHNQIIRKSINLSKQSHVLVANIDHLFLIVTLTHPFTPVEFIDRILLNAEVYHIVPHLIFNKEDLFTEKEDAKYQELQAIYEDLGYSTYKVNALESDLNRIKEQMVGKTSFFIGQSGVGKSTLINRLVPGLNLKTTPVSDSYQTGQHTTTFAEMFPIPEGGFIVDSPGVKAFGIVDLEQDEVALYFPEMKKRLEHCKFYNCKHINEPKCEVKKAVENGEIAYSRYRSYLSIFEDCQEQNHFRKPDHLK